MTRSNEKGLSGGVHYGPPPKRGPNPQGLTEKKFKSVKKYTKKLIRKAPNRV
jgi:hypothetical protein|tara:strand:- start:921 stop:1076 length:156 start_codon:yes stop_codon:yes gene_type:complete